MLHSNGVFCCCAHTVFSVIFQGYAQQNAASFCASTFFTQDKHTSDKGNSSIHSSSVKHAGANKKSHYEY